MSRIARTNILAALNDLSGQSLVQADFAGMEMRMAASLGVSVGNARALGKSASFGLIYGRGSGRSNFAQMMGRMTRSHLELPSINVGVNLETGWMKCVVTDADVSVTYGPKEGRRAFCSGSLKISFQDALLFARSLIPQNLSAVFIDSRTGQTESKMRPSGAKGKWLVRIRMTNDEGNWMTVRGDPRKLVGFAVRLESVVSQKIVTEVMAT